MRTAHFRGNAWQKCDFAALYYTLLCKYCKEISWTNGKVTSRRVRGGAPRAPGAAARCPRFITLYCVSIAKRLSENTNMLLQGLIRGGAPRAPGAALYSNSAAGSHHARRARSCIVVHFTCPLCGRASVLHCGHIYQGAASHCFEGTFHVFALQGKNISLFGVCYVRFSLTLQRRKISRPEPPNIVCAYCFCLAALDIIF